MYRRRKNSGFTMAEMLIVVAIIIVLTGVVFIAVQRHQRSLAQLERNAIAKELYFAAQNHLTMAESQGYLGVTNDGNTEDAEKGIYYIVNNGAPGANSMLNLMLPFGSIDETVRCGGSYLIRYQVNPATVLDVFYCSRSGKPGKFNHPISESEYNTFLGYKNKLPDTGYVVGWFGGGDIGQAGIMLDTPTVEITNDSRLFVTVTDPNANKKITTADGTEQSVDTVLELIISGETVEGKTAKAVILLRDPSNSGFTANSRVSVGSDGVYTVVLDDITTPAPLNGDGMHFADLNGYANSSMDPTIWFMSDGSETNPQRFRPGEDITVEAVVFSNSVLTNIAYSSAKMANSLFADDILVDDEGNAISDHTKARIANIRHLENLDASVSYFAYATFMTQSGATGINATQTQDLAWAEEGNDNAFTAVIEDASVYRLGEKEGEGTKAGCFLPINTDYKLTYDGCEAIVVGLTTSYVQHTITGVKVDTSSETDEDDKAAGLFGAPTGTLTVQNLALIDFDITGAGNAGALAGTLNGATVSNVVAYNTAAFDKDGDGNIKTTVTGAGSAGGLIGAMTGSSVEKCAAALVVSGGSNAGGLIGSASGGSVTASYSGGHTDKAEYYSHDSSGERDAAMYNVTATDTAGIAGGLIGDAGSAAITNCYSTCSATGATAGGFVGKASGSISDCYATGLVSGSSKEGAFAGTCDGSATGCHYYEIINEVPIEQETGEGDSVIVDFDYLKAVNGADYANITPFDTTADYEDFVSPPNRVTVVYDSTLVDYYGGEDPLLYPLGPLTQLGSSITVTATDTAPADFVATHYGDWPAPEILVVNP